MEKRIIEEVAKEENIKVGEIVKNLQDGSVVILKNKKRKSVKPVGIGKNLRTKVNANIGTSPDFVSIKREMRKLEVAIKSLTDTVMDLSIGGDLKFIRRKILENSTVPVGTVPIYQVICETVRKGKRVKDMDPKHMLDVIYEQADDGVDFMTLHCGVTMKSVRILKKSRRLCGIVSRGGGFLAEWVIENKKENPLYKNFDKILEIAKKYDITLSLGDGLRPGAISDANDSAQISELSVLGELTMEARKNGVQVIIEGPGHMRLDQIVDHVKLQKKITNNAPFYLLGPIVTDIAAGFDHIAAAIGGAVASAYGADFLCYVTPSEHIRLPDVEDVYLGVIASRIAAHAGDIVKGIKWAKEVDDEFAKARKRLDWNRQAELSLDPIKFKKERKKIPSITSAACSMCGKYCIMREISKFGI